MKSEEYLNEVHERFSCIIIELSALGKEYTNREVTLKVMRAFQGCGMLKPSQRENPSI